MPSQQKNRDVRPGSGKLEPPRGDHGHPAGFHHHGTGRPIVQGILHHGQCGLVVSRLGMDHPGRGKARLRQTRRVQINPAAHPQGGPADAPRLPRGDAGEEERGGGIIRLQTVLRRHLVQCAGAQAAPCQPPIQERDAKGDEPAIGRRRHLGLQPGDGIWQGITKRGHEGKTRSVRLMFQHPPPKVKPVDSPRCRSLLKINDARGIPIRSKQARR